MTTKMNRRSYLASQVALAAAATALPAAATETLPGAAAPLGTVDWRTASAADLRRFVGDRFRVSSPDSPDVVLRLIEVEAVPFGPDIPADLPRSEGVIAVFDSPDKAPLVEGGHLTRRVSHAHLGSADLFIGPVRKRDGSDILELTLS